MARTRAQMNDMVNELLKHPKHFRVLDTALQLGSNWVDLSRVAALLVPTAYWGNDKRARDTGPTFAFPAAELRCVINKMNVERSMGTCIFEITMNDKALFDVQEFYKTLSVKTIPQYLRTLLYYYSTAQLWVPPGPRHRKLEFLFDCVEEAKAKAKQKGGIAA